MAPTGYVNVSLKRNASDALVKLTADVTGVLGRRVSQSDALLIVAHLLGTHTSPKLLATEIVMAAFELGIAQE